VAGPSRGPRKPKKRILPASNWGTRRRSVTEESCGEDLAGWKIADLTD